MTRCRRLQPQPSCRWWLRRHHCRWCRPSLSERQRRRFSPRPIQARICRPEPRSLWRPRRQRYLLPPLPLRSCDTHAPGVPSRDRADDGLQPCDDGSWRWPGHLGRARVSTSRRRSSCARWDATSPPSAPEQRARSPPDTPTATSSAWAAPSCRQSRPDRPVEYASVTPVTDDKNQAMAHRSSTSADAPMSRPIRSISG